MMLTRILNTKTPLYGKTSLRSIAFDELSFERMGDETVRSSRHKSQRGARDEVQKEQDWDEPASDHPGEEMTLQAIWNCLD